jgi:hypothetical protein
MICTIALCTGVKVGIRANHARAFVFGMSACTYAWVYMTSHSVVFIGSRIVSYARARIVLITHTCAYSLRENFIGAEGAQRIAAALVHNSTLQTL